MNRRQLVQASLALPLGAQAQGGADPLVHLLRERLRYEGVGLAVARVRPEGRVALAAEGRSGHGGTPLDANRHRFEIGSLTKTFIGLLLADASLYRALPLQTAVEDLLPDGIRLRDKAGLPLRLVDVATHRSGLPRLPEPFAPKDAQDPYADFGDAELLAALRAFRPRRGREEAFEYSNFGFGLLGWLLARRARQPLDALLRERVLAPLGLEAMLAPHQDADSARGHNPAGQPVPAWHFSDATAGAGALRATAAQLARYAQAALGQFAHPLREAFDLALSAHSPLPLGPHPMVRMGLGWMVAEREGRQIATHDGGTFGFSSSLWLDRTRGHAGLALANASVPVTDLAQHLMDEARPLRDMAAERHAQQAAMQQPQVALSAEQAGALAGVYALNPQFRITVRADGGRLFAQATGQGEFELFAKAPRQLFARVAVLDMHFEEGTPAPALTLLQGGQRLRFLRE